MLVPGGRLLVSLATRQFVVVGFCGGFTTFSIFSFETLLLAERQSPMLAVMNVNLCGALRCLQQVLPGMRERRSGVIVNVTSVAGRFGAIGQAPYVASKWAFEGMSEEERAKAMEAFRSRRDGEGGSGGGGFSRGHGYFMLESQDFRRLSALPGVR